MGEGNLTLQLMREYVPDWVPAWSLPIQAALVGVGVLIGFIAIMPLFFVWLERKVSGHIQCRLGPMYAGGWHGWAQTIADGIKLFQKEDMIPIGADKPLFVLAPAIVLGSVFAAMAAFPFSYEAYFAGLPLGVFMILALSSTTTIGVIMAGWASNSKWSLYGAMREAAQVVAYEIPLGLSLLVPLMAIGTFSLIDASAQQAGWYGMHWAIFQNPFVLPAFLIFFTAALAETKRAPFDLPEAESELVAGFLTEYSGIRWSFFFMEEYAAMFLMSAVAGFFFFGGFESPLTYFAREMFNEPGGMALPELLKTHGTVVGHTADHWIVSVMCAVTAILKGVAGVFLMMWLRWTLPRIRIDQVMTMGYKYLTPLALLCVLGAGIFEALWAWFTRSN